MLHMLPMLSYIRLITSYSVLNGGAVLFSIIVTDVFRTKTICYLMIISLSCFSKISKKWVLLYSSCTVVAFVRNIVQRVYDISYDITGQCRFFLAHPVILQCICCIFLTIKFVTYLRWKSTKERIPEMTKGKCKVFEEKVTEKFAHSERWKEIAVMYFN